jgi:hypothetical protein
VVHFLLDDTVSFGDYTAKDILDINSLGYYRRRRRRFFAAGSATTVTAGPKKLLQAEHLRERRNEVNAQRGQ